MNAELLNSGNGSPSAGAVDTQWAAVRGLWEFQGHSATYTGPSSSDGSPPYGIALSNWNLTDGKVRVHVKFEQVNSEGQVAAGVVLGFQSERSRYVVVQLGGYGRAYSIVEYAPGVGWQALENVGSARNLEPNKEYAIDVTQTGQEIRMMVNSVAVVERVLGEPLSGSQLGLLVVGQFEFFAG